MIYNGCNYKKFERRKNKKNSKKIKEYFIKKNSKEILFFTSLLLKIIAYQKILFFIIEKKFYNKSYI